MRAWKLAFDRRLVLVGVGIALCAAGCESTGTSGGLGPGSPEYAAEAPVQDPLLPGIPLPPGFKLVTERSTGRVSGEFRVATNEYAGDMSVTSVRRWYAERMPTAGFVKRQEHYRAGEYRLRFDSDTEECNILIYRDRSKTVLVVDVGPLPRGSADYEAGQPGRRR